MGYVRNIQNPHKILSAVTRVLFLINFACILLISNHTTFLVQFEINCTRKFFMKLKLHSASAILILSEKPTRPMFIPTNNITHEMTRF